MVEIDGSFGEGGGQILRTSLSLSCLLERPFRIYNIRKGRKRPGLMPQHITSVRAASAISGATVRGDSKGSLELVFEPKRVRPGDYSFDIGTAGSTSLVFQSLLPPLLFAGGNSTLILKGGTHVPFSPPFHYISEVFIPILGPLGIDVGAEIETYGFYPRGGGKIFYSINPCRGIRQSDFTERGNLLGIKGISAVGNLPKSIARKQMDSLLKGLGEFKAEIETSEVDTHGQGTFVFIRAEFEGALTGFSALGERGKRAEKVGEEAASEFFEYFRSGASLDPHMADQIVLYLALAEGKSTFTTSRISEHLRTNLHVIGKFMDVRSEIEPPHRVTIAGRRPH